MSYGAGGRMQMEWSTNQNTGVYMLYNGLNELAWTRTFTYGACSNEEISVLREFFTFTPDGRALELMSENASETFADYIWLDDVPVAQIRDTYDDEGGYIGSEITYIHTDYLGTPRIGTDDNKSITWSYESDAFGNATPQGTADVRLRLPGQIDLGLEGIHYNYYRTYDPRTGRYLESDPVGIVGGKNTFAYVDNNPMSGKDPLGLVEWAGTGVMYGAIVGGGGVFGIYDLYSECVSNNRVHVRLHVAGPAAGWGLPLSGTGGEIRLEDGFRRPDYRSLEGSYKAVWGTIALGAGYSLGAIQLGEARSLPARGLVGGIDYSLGVAAGRAWVVEHDESACCGR